MDYVDYLQEKETKDKIYLRWAIGFQKEISFNEFIKAITPEPPKTTEEILEDVFEIIRLTCEGREEADGNI